MLLAATFLPFALAAGFTPGPNNLMLAASGANFGFRRTSPHILGIVCGFPLLLLAVGVGLGTLFQTNPEVHTVLKVVGAAFLLYLAWRIATANRTSTKTRGRPLTFLEAFFFQWINLKAWIFSVSAIATYTTVEGRTELEIGIILAVASLVTVGSTITWTVFGVGLSQFLQDSPRMLQTFNIGMALLLVLSIVPMVT